ncbi:unnamed protein product, partial [Polarella glacialis]
LLADLDRASKSLPRSSLAYAAELAVPKDEIEAASSGPPRRCVCLDFLDPGPGVQAAREEALAELARTVHSVRSGEDKEGPPLPVLVIWYGNDPAEAEAQVAMLPSCALMVRPPFPEEANRLVPGVKPWLQHRGYAAMHGFVSLQAFNLLEIDQLLYLGPGTELAVPAAEAFAAHSE